MFHVKLRCPLIEPVEIRYRWTSHFDQLNGAAGARPECFT